MRIISLVPSWTETLIESGVYPVGRTRFCIHPQGQVEKIPIVGGTKTVNWDLVRELKPDLLILDKEENPREMSEQGIPFWSSQITNGAELEKSLYELAHFLQNENLRQWAKLAGLIDKTPAKLPIPTDTAGILEILKPWISLKPIAYMIWKDPWMAVSKETYIGYVLGKLGYEIHSWPQAKNKYPEVELDLNSKLIYFFSSEPYPFAKHKKELLKLDIECALVDGEKFSWFGIRSLKFLQKALQLSDLK